MTTQEPYASPVRTRPRTRRQVRSTMRAVVQDRFGPPSVLAVEEVPIPAPGPGEVLVRVEAASVNAQDWHVMRGEPRIARLMAPKVFRLIRPRVAVRGTDLVGEVVAVGERTARWAPGDRVVGQGSGTFAEHAVARGDRLAALPSGVTLEQAAALPLAATTALECLEAAGTAPGMRVLINGASGGVGTFAVQLARGLGLRVTAVVSARNAALVRRLGAEHVVDYATHDFTTEAAAHDVVLDLVGNRRLAELRRTVRPGGALVLSGGGNPGDGRFIGPMALLVQAQLQSRRSDVALITPSPTPSTAVLERLLELVRTGAVAPVIDRCFPFEQTAEAITYMETEHTRGKVVIRMP